MKRIFQAMIGSVVFAVIFRVLDQWLTGEPDCMAGYAAVYLAIAAMFASLNRQEPRQ